VHGPFCNFQTIPNKSMTGTLLGEQHKFFAEFFSHSEPEIAAEIVFSFLDSRSSLGCFFCLFVCLFYNEKYYFSIAVSKREKFYLKYVSAHEIICLSVSLLYQDFVNSIYSV